jgi:hypothetical protein
MFQLLLGSFDAFVEDGQIVCHNPPLYVEKSLVLLGKTLEYVTRHVDKHTESLKLVGEIVTLDVQTI